jgi:hypothetical protein
MEVQMGKEKPNYFTIVIGCIVALLILIVLVCVVITVTDVTIKNSKCANALDMDFLDVGVQLFQGSDDFNCCYTEMNIVNSVFVENRICKAMSLVKRE